jgi:hypothetical protein
MRLCRFASEQLLSRLNVHRTSLGHLLVLILILVVIIDCVLRGVELRTLHAGVLTFLKQANCFGLDAKSWFDELGSMSEGHMLQVLARRRDRRLVTRKLISVLRRRLA